jgi:ribokinase
LPPDLTVVGSANLDLVARVERLPRPGETVTDAEFFTAPGGKGANQAVAAARLGARVRFVGAVGDDAFADEALSGLRESGCELSLRKADARTGVAVIYVDGDGENTIVVAPGANERLRPDDVELEGDDAVLAQLEIPPETVDAAARSSRGFFALNAAPAKPVSPDVVRRADLVVVNRYELEALEEMPRLAALTLGADGAILLENGNEVARAAAPRVDAVDGTAAGDAFTACLVVSLLEGRPRDEALARACKAGALAATRPGAQPSLPTAGEVDAL